MKKNLYVLFALLVALMGLVAYLSSERFACIAPGKLTSVRVEKFVSRISSKPYVCYDVNFSSGDKQYSHLGCYDSAPHASGWDDAAKLRAEEWIANHPVGNGADVKYHCIWPIFSVSSVGDMTAWQATARKGLLLNIGVAMIFILAGLLLVNRLRKHLFQ